MTKHIVVAGDTVSGIADRFGMSTSRLLALNGLKPESIIFPKQTLKLSASEANDSTASTSRASTTASASRTATNHIVRSGDTMTELADAAGVSLNALLAANSLTMNSIIYPGQNVVIPRSTAATNSASAPDASAADTSAENVIEDVAYIEMNSETRRNAETIIRVGRELGVSDYGIVIALAAAMQESGLRNLDHGDRDSLGVFQQRSSTGWGTADEVRDIERASLAFFGGTMNPNPGITRGLLDIPGWANMTVSQAAQAVQISGYPNFYAKWEGFARSWLNELG